MTMIRNETYRSSSVNMPATLSSNQRQQKAVHFNSGSGSLSRQRESLCPSHGLLNAPGDNNCFLNSAVQIFWHLDVFRRNFRRLQEHVCLGNACIFCGIKMLFHQFQESAGTAFSPDMLRRALATAFENQQRFQLGCMDDAVECFENILLRIHYHIQGTAEVASCTHPLCIAHRKFSINITETYSCADCHHNSDPLSFPQMVHYVAVNSLCENASQMRQRGVKSLTGLFGKLLRKANECGDQHICRRCGSHSVELRRTLTNQPDIVTIGLAWDSEKSKTQTISDVLHTIDTNICLCHLYQSVSDTQWASSVVHHLVGLICFYGRHYSAFFYHSPYQTWMHFDDARVTEIGPDWAQVVSKCVKNHYQPLLLFYTNPEAAPLGAHKKTEMPGVPSPELFHGVPMRSSQSAQSFTAGNTALKPRPPARTVSRPSSNRSTPISAVGDGSELSKKITADKTLRTHAGGPNGIMGSNSTIQHRNDSQRNHNTRRPARDGVNGCGNGNGNFGHGSSRLTSDGANYMLGWKSRSSVTSSSIASLESFDSYENVHKAYPAGCSKLKDQTEALETDSGYPSGDQASASSSVEIPPFKHNSTTKSSISGQSVNRTHYIQMLLRADDFITSASLKEDQADLLGAMRLLEQAGSLLQTCSDPLTACPQLAQAATVKQIDCCKKLRVLHEKITTHRLSSIISSQPVFPDTTTTLSGPTGCTGTVRATVEKLHREKLQLKCNNLDGKENDGGNEMSLRRVHKSKRKATGKSLGSQQLNRSMPDLSQPGEALYEDRTGTTHRKVNNIKKHWNGFPSLSTFQNSSLAEAHVRSFNRDLLLNELLHHRLTRSSAVEIPSSTSYCPEDLRNEYDDLPPPPPEMLLPSRSPSPQNLHSLGSTLTKSTPENTALCSLCGRKRVHGIHSYCLDCNLYMSRFCHGQ